MLIASSFDWTMDCSAFFVIGGLRHSIENHSNHAPLLQPIKSKTKTNDVTCARAFFHALRQLHVFALPSFDWITGLSVFFVIGQCDYFGFVFWAIIRNSL